VLFGIGTYDGIQAKRISDDITNHNISTHWDPNIRDLQAEGQRYEDKQITYMVTGGAVLLVGVVVTLIGHNRAAEHVAIAPIASPSSIGVAVSGGF
jgi:hypothetical protein